MVPIKGLLPVSSVHVLCLVLVRYTYKYLFLLFLSVYVLCRIYDMIIVANFGYFCSKFTGDFSDPRPPEEADMVADMTNSQLLDTSVLDNDPATTDLLMQLFLSELTPEEELNKLGCVASTAPPTAQDLDREQSVTSTASTPTSSLATVPQLPSPQPLVPSNSGTSSEAPSPAPVSDLLSRGNATCDDVISALMFPASPLECTDTSGFNDPLDNPFLTEFTDFSDFLQDPSVFNSVPSVLTSSPSTTPTTTPTSTCSNKDTTLFSQNVVSEFGPSPSPVSNNTDVNVTDTHVEDDLNLFDLSQSTSIVPPSDATEMENLDIDFSTFCTDTLSLVPNSPDELTTEQLSVMLSQAQQTTSSVECSSNLPSVSNSDDVFVETSPSSFVSDQLSVEDQPVESSATISSRKRTTSDCEVDESGSPPDAKKTKLTRRQKNNIASQVSRAKRRAKNTSMFDRVSELESENALLRIKEKELATEIERLKKLLVTRLSQ